jgi:crotonobetaine/carnitine-CoA ligase
MNNTPAFAAETLADLVRGAADRWADRPALIFDDPKTTLSFADIEAGTNAIANVLADIGVAYGNRVAVMLRNRPEFPLIWLALAKLGAVMVPVNVYYQETDAAFVLSHSGATMIITEGDFVPLATKMRGKVATVQLVVSIENVEESATIKSLAARLPGAPKSVLLQRQIYPETIANIQYTSGTTGKPKGCMLSHKYWCRLGRIVADGPPELSETDVLLTAQPFYYMDPQWNLTGAFQVGATLVVLDRFHPSTFWSKVREYHVSFFYCLGMMPAAMYAMPPSGLDREHEVRAISCSAIPTRLHAALEQRWGVPWYEAFGMTETGGDLRIQPRDHDDTIGKACIGRPYYDREVRVVDSDNQQVPRGTQGEMVLRGVGMMEGYFEDEEATNRAFVGGWFHTGDLVREDEQGRIFYLGRTKDTIRRSGENISAAEVEGVLIEHPDVFAAACVPVPDDLRGEEVKAYVVLREGVPEGWVPPEALSKWCSDRLAYFKVPRFWTFVGDLPRTPSERVAKSVLVEGVTDLRAGAFDSVEGTWR